MTKENRVFIIAEAGSNWRMGTPERDIRMAKTLIDVAAAAGADAVKFQTYRAETIYVQQAGQVKYLQDAGVSSDIGDIFKDLAMPYEMIPELHAYCQMVGIQFMSTAFSGADFEAVDPYVEVHKIASCEINHLRLLELAAASKKPILISTGATIEEDIAWALEVLEQQDSGPVTLLQCTLRYPTPPESLNLRAIPWMAHRFGVAVGLSDHSRHPIHAPVAAVALGATVIEKHFTLDNRLPGPDHFFAVTPEELRDMVLAIRETEAMLGTGHKVIQRTEEELYRFGRRAIQATRNIPQGGILQEGVNMAILRPGHRTRGVHPKLMPLLEGKKTTRVIAAGEGIQEGDWSND